VQRTVVITNPQGLHMRPCAAFVETASRFASEITVRHGDRSGNGKSIFDLFLLVALPGSELVIDAEGADAAEALDALEEVLKRTYEN
jgi:phosphotransferase system HPr (HPr) family protein